VTAVIRSAPGDPVVHVPREAVIRGARADRVVVAEAEGRFARRTVVVGREASGRVAITSGVRAGERVVTTGVFLIDSETNLRAGFDRIDGGEQAPPSGAVVAPDAPTHQH
jgi:Cu(I)/Ag(I) efflux system membrane fusion protein